MDEKNESEKIMEEMKRIGEGFNKFIESIGEALNKLFYPQEDEWKMKCPYDVDDEVYALDFEGYVFDDSWRCKGWELNAFNQGNIFLSRKAAELEAKRRNLLTRFRAFRDECNNGWKADWGNFDEYKYYIICEKCTWVKCSSTCFFEEFVMFGYFRNHLDCERAIKLFGDEIKELFVEGEV